MRRRLILRRIHYSAAILPDGIEMTFEFSGQPLAFDYQHQLRIEICASQVKIIGTDCRDVVSECKGLSMGRNPSVIFVKRDFQSRQVFFLRK